MHDAQSADARRLADLARRAYSEGWHIRPASTESDFLAAFGLVHAAYAETSLDPYDPDGFRVTPWHLTDQATVYVVADPQERFLATATFVEDGPTGLPCEAIYADAVRTWRQRGRLAEVGSLASVRDRRSLPAVVFLMLFSFQTCRRRAVDYLFVAVHPRHSRWYIRQFGFCRANGLRSYPAVNNRPAVLLALDVAEAPRHRPELYAATDWSWFPTEACAPHPIPQDLRPAFSSFLGSPSALPP